MHPAAQRALTELATHPRWRGTRVAYASRTEHDEWARQCLRLFRTGDGCAGAQSRTLLELASVVEIRGGSKKKHFSEIARQTGVPFDRMLFFDNEHYNCAEVAQLGTSCVYCPGGLKDEHWAKGLAQFAAARRRAGAGADSR